MIAMYNYKGGVGKTTIAINLVAMLARQGRRTLLVDCDPQSNATSFYLGTTQTEDGDSEDEDQLPDINRPLGLLYQDQENSEEDIVGVDDEDEETEDEHDEDHTASDVEEEGGRGRMRHPTVKLTSDRIPPSVKEPKWAVDIDDIRRRREPTVYNHLRVAMRGAINPKEELPVKRVRGIQNLWILPGDPRLVRLETNFMDSLNFHGDFFIHGLAGFRHMMYHIASNPELEIEYVVVDLGPSAGAINQVIILNCDYILPPLLADYFSVCSMDGLLNTLIPHWLDFLDKYRHEIRNRPLEKEDRRKYRKFGSPPKILPFLMNGYPMRDGIIVRNYAVWSQTMTNFVDGPGSRVDQRVKNLLIRDGEEKIFVNFCKDLVSLMKVSHAIRKPVVAMQGADVGSTMWTNNMKIQTRHAKERYRRLARFIQQLG